MRASAVLLGLLWWLAVCLGAWLGLFLLDNALHLPAGLRLPLAAGAGALALWGFAKRILQPALKRPKVERTARALETQYAIRDNLLINACQFEPLSFSSAERPFAERTIGASSLAVGRMPASALWRPDRLRAWGLGAGAILAVWLFYGAVLPRYAGNALARYALPLADIPPASALALKITPAADLVVGEGDDLDVRAAIRRTGADASGGENAPVLVRSDGAGFVEPVKTAGEAINMRPDPRTAGAFVYTFRMVQRPFAFRVFAADAYSRSVRVDVRPVPRITASLFRVTPPHYTGRPPVESPGPPLALSGLPGSKVEVEIRTDRTIANAAWSGAGEERSFAKARDRWLLRSTIASAGGYEVKVTDSATAKRTLAAQGEIRLDTDNPPEVDFVTDDRNRFVNPGASIPLQIRASDDFGVRSLQVVARKADTEGKETAVKTWTYLGPPGRSGTVEENFTLAADPEAFIPGEVYLVEAVCADFQPGGALGRSRPLVLRVKSWSELGVPPTDVLAGAVDLLKKAIASQRSANALTENLNIHLSEAIQKKSLPEHQKAMTDRQREAHGYGLSALAEFRKNKTGAVYAAVLGPLVEGEMPWALADIAKIGACAADRLPELVRAVGGRQQYILSQLISLLGRLSDERKREAAANRAVDEAAAPKPTAEEVARQLKDDLEKFARAERRVVDANRSLLDHGPEDLTQKEQEILGELAREEAKWSKFFEEKLTDLSKLPLQDFADGSIAKELNEVYQEVKLADKSLYEKKLELAVPQEQSGLEKAEELVHNLERWLPDTPDHLKWLMEEPPAPSDIPIAELPAELEDITGDLLDKEEEMADDVEDVTSSWMDSLDKGAGWDAMDGPISDMSARGVTGNQLPNQQEIGGRAGEGRTGRSHGQFVEETAEGKGGRETPTRLTPSPFESGSVKDSSKQSPGGATGGGKLAGFAEEGLRGPAPTPRLDKMARLSGEQGKIRQQAETLSLKLRAYHLPTGDLETSVAAMKQFEKAASTGDGLRVRRMYSRIMDSLEDAQASVRSEAGLHREYSKLPERVREEIMTGLQDATPAGYEEMVAEYFRALAEGREKAR